MVDSLDKKKQNDIIIIKKYQKHTSRLVVKTGGIFIKKNFCLKTQNHEF